MRKPLVALFLVLTVVLAGCGANKQGPGSTSQMASGQVDKNRPPYLYDLQAMTFTHIPMESTGLTSTQEIQPAGDRFVLAQSGWENKEPYKFTMITLDGQAVKLPTDEVIGKKWVAYKDRILVFQPQEDSHPARWVEVLPTVGKAYEDTASLTTTTKNLEGFRIQAVTEKGFYAFEGFNDLVFLDPEMRRTKAIKVSGTVPENVMVTGENSLLIAGSPFDLMRQDFEWDASGSKKTSYPDAGWASYFTASVDANGVIWMPYQGDDYTLAIQVLKNGEKVVFNGVAPHRLTSRTLRGSVSTIATPDKLVVAAFGLYKNQPGVFVYQFPAVK